MASKISRFIKNYSKFINYFMFIIIILGAKSSDVENELTNTTAITSIEKAEKFEIKNVTVHAVYIEDAIRLNISWDVRNDEFPGSYDFIIKLDVEVYDVHYPFCSIFSLETFEKKKNLRNVILPNYNYIHEIRPGCPYVIKIIRRLTYGKYENTVNYTSPECVQDHCDCKYYTPNAEIFAITHISKDVYNVTFLQEDFSLYNRTYNITYVELRIKEPIVHHSYMDLEEHIIKRGKNYALINFTGLIRPGKNYTLEAIFSNNVYCKKISNKSFYHAEEMISLPIQTAKSKRVEIFAPFIIILIILLGLIIYYRKKIFRIKILRFCPFFGTYNDDTLSVTTICKIPDNVIIHNQREQFNILYVDQHEFDKSRVILIKEIGKGYFGKVYKAKILNDEQKNLSQIVAVKTLRENAPPEEMEDFLSEIEIFKKIKEHKNVVKLIGCCTRKEPYMMIMEYIPCGDLLNYLLNLRQQWTNKQTRLSYFFTGSSEDGEYILPNTPASTVSTNRLPSVTETEYTTISTDCETPLLDKPNPIFEIVLDHNELENFAYQIASGMAHLEKIPITHRDLAARNILMNDKKVLKISDFGLSRTGPYINNRLKKLPLRWMAIESIEDHFFDNKSDIWSFAVVLWEIGTLGAFPYENTPNDLVLHDLIIGKRLERPEICTDELYSLMLRCWSRDPNLRPTFEELEELLDKRKRIYVNFSQLNPSYVFPPTKMEY